MTFIIIDFDNLSRVFAVLVTTYIKLSVFAAIFNVVITNFRIYERALRVGYGALTNGNFIFVIAYGLTVR